MPGKRVARPVKRDVRKRGWVAAALVVVLVAAGALLGQATGLFSGAEDDKADSSASPSSEPSSPSPSSESSSPSTQATDDARSRAEARARELVRACAADLSAADRVVAAAAPGVADWHSHVQARTDMLERRISPARMRAIWARTRVAGPGDQTRFHAAMKKYDSTSDCGALEKGPDAGDRPVAACVTRAGLADRAVAAGEAAMGDWESHLANMAAYAHGHMSSGMAQHEWVGAWRKAPVHISAFSRARAALAAAPSCEETRG